MDSKKRIFVVENGTDETFRFTLLAFECEIIKIQSIQIKKLTCKGVIKSHSGVILHNKYEHIQQYKRNDINKYTHTAGEVGERSSALCRPLCVSAPITTFG